jgi:hypothetical protein
VCLLLGHCCTVADSPHSSNDCTSTTHGSPSHMNVNLQCNKSQKIIASCDSMEQGWLCPVLHSCSHYLLPTISYGIWCWNQYIDWWLIQSCFSCAYISCSVQSVMYIEFCTDSFHVCTMQILPCYILTQILYFALPLHILWLHVLLLVCWSVFCD